MKMVYKVTYSDGTVVQATAGPRDVVDYERQYGISFTDDRTTAEQAYWLAWRPLNRTGKDTRDFEGFLNAIEDVESVDGTEAPTPVPFEEPAPAAPAPSDDSSPTSPPQE